MRSSGNCISRVDQAWNDFPDFFLRFSDALRSAHRRTAIHQCQTFFTIHGIQQVVLTVPSTRPPPHPCPCCSSVPKRWSMMSRVTCGGALPPDLPPISILNSITHNIFLLYELYSIILSLYCCFYMFLYVYSLFY